MKLGKQHQKIVDMCADGEFKCQTQFWNISKSPHKRRGELQELGYHFEDRCCVHGIKLSKDFRPIAAPHKPCQVIEELPNGNVRETYV
jgi:hypothetical protein